MAQEVSCPRCGRRHEWRTGNPFRPFCSERCKLIDLGGWLGEKNAIPGEPAKYRTTTARSTEGTIPFSKRRNDFIRARVS